MRASDTSQEAANLQDRILRELGGPARLQLAVELSSLARDLAKARLRSQNPGWTESDCDRELLRYAFHPLPLPAPLR